MCVSVLVMILQRNKTNRLSIHGYVCGGSVAQSCPTLATPWTVARQASLSMVFSRQEHWRGLPFPVHVCVRAISWASSKLDFLRVRLGNYIFSKFNLKEFCRVCNPWSRWEKHSRIIMVYLKGMGCSKTQCFIWVLLQIFSEPFIHQ